MLVLLSPAKSLNEEKKEYPIDTTQAKFRTDALELASVLKKYKAKDIKKLMKVSDALADENYSRFQKFSKTHTKKNSLAAIYTFNGDVYRGFDADSLSKQKMSYTQDHLRILSGMYGYLKPMDLIQAYRLEMGSKLKNDKGKNLYAFWDDKITKQVNADLKKTGSKYLVNLASKEYFSAIKKDKIQAPVIDIHFREDKGGELKFYSYNAKRARGLMANYIVSNKIKSLSALQKFNTEDYKYEASISSDKELFFVR